MNSSPFIHFFNTQNHKYVFDVNSNDIIQVSDLVFDCLHLLVSGLEESEIVRTLQGQYERSDVRNSLDSIKEMQEKNIYFSSSRPKQISMFCCSDSMKLHYDKFINQLTFEVTQRCNLNCRYCVYSGIYEGQRVANNKDMTWDVMKPGLDFMIEHGGKSPNPFYRNDVEDVFQYKKHDIDFSIGFYGGEPLLNYPLIRKGVEYLERHKKNGKKNTYTVTTNGTLLTEEMIRFFCMNNVSVALSLDGPQSVHDRARVYANNKGSFQDVMNALHLIHDTVREMDSKYHPFYVSVLSILTGDFDYREILDFFCSLEPLLCAPHLIGHVSFNTMTGGLDKWNEHYLDDPMQPPTGYDELRKEYEKYCIDGSLKKNDISWRLKLLNELVMNDFYFFVHGRTRYQYTDDNVIPEMSHPGGICPIGSRRPFMKVDGTILPCERIPTEDPYYRIGDHHKWIDVDRCAQLLDEYTQATYEDCRNCWCHRMCGITCLKHCVVDGKVDAKKKKMLCNNVRINRNAEMIDMMELLEKEPTALDHFNQITMI